MQERRLSDTHAESTTWVWIILAGLLVLAGVLAMVSMGIINMNQQNQQPTGTQPAPATAPSPAR